MNKEELRKKLIEFTNNFSFITTTANEIEKIVDSVILSSSKIHEDQSPEFPNFVLSNLKKQIKEKINIEYKNDRDNLFNKLFDYISKEKIDDVRKLKLLTVVIKALDTQIEEDYYKVLLEKYSELKKQMSYFLIRNNNNTITMNLELLSMYMEFSPLLNEYIKLENITITIEDKDENENSSNKFLNLEAVKALYRRLRSGDETAREELILHNRKLVHKIARRFNGKGIDYDDLYQEGLIGLNTAIDRYKPELGYAFSTYATWWIRQRIKRYLDDNLSTIRLPVHKRDWIGKLNRQISNLEKKLGRNPNTQEILEETGLTYSELQEYWTLNTPATSLNKKIENGTKEADEIGAFIADEKNYYDTVLNEMTMQKILDELRSILTEKQFIIVCMRNGLLEGDDKEYTLEEIGKKFNVTRERIRQIEAKAYSRLKHNKLLKQLNYTRNGATIIRNICKNDVESINYLKLISSTSSDTILNDNEIAKKMNITIDELFNIKNRVIDILLETEEREYASILLTKIMGKKDLQSTQTNSLPLEIKEKLDSKSFRKILEKKYSDEEIETIIESLEPKEIELLKKRYGENLDEILPVTDSKVLKKIDTITKYYIPKKIKIANNKKTIKDLSNGNITLEDALKKIYPNDSKEELLSLLTPEERDFLTKEYNQNKSNNTNVIEEMSIKKLEYVILKRIDEELRKINNTGKYHKKAKSFKQILEEKYSEKEISKIMSSLTEEELKLLQERYGENLDRVIELDDPKIKVKINNLVHGSIAKRIKKEKKEQKNQKIQKNFKQILEEKYSTEEIEKIKESLTEEDLKILQTKYGEDLEAVKDIDDKEVNKKINLILYKKIPKFLKTKISKKVDTRESNEIEGIKGMKSFKQILEEKYSKEEIETIMSNLSEEDKKTLQNRYGENLDTVIDIEDDKVKRRANHIVYTKIPKSLVVKKERIGTIAVGIKTPKEKVTRAKSLKVILEEKYSKEEIETIISNLSEEDKKTLQNRYGENLDTVIDIEDDKVKKRANHIVYTKIPKSLVVKKERIGTIAVGIKTPKEKVTRAKSLKEILEEKYSKEEIETIISNLSEEDKKTLQNRYGENLDTVIDIEDDKIKRRISHLIYYKIPKSLIVKKESLGTTLLEIKVDDEVKENEEDYLSKLKRSLLELRNSINNVLTLIDEESKTKASTTIKKKNK